MKRLLLWLPLAVFALFVAAVASRLADPVQRPVVSKLVGQRMPGFNLTPAVPDRPGVASAGGGPRLVNIFASWCIPCIAEAPQLLALQRAGVRIEGIAVRDKPEDLARFLREHGNPFAAVGADADGRVQVALGSAGVPETFVVDRQGIIRHQHLGVIDRSDVPELLRRLERLR